jgi:large subunit ribosomal protein L35
MPKMKSRRSAAKRFKRTGSGRWKRAHALLRHNLTKKSSHRKRRLHAGALVDPSDQHRVDRMLPYR